MNGRVVRCYLEADLRCGHGGLSALAKKDKINVENLSPGEYVIFINRLKNRVKLYAASNVLAYLKLEQGRKLDMTAIREIPRAFGASGRIEYDKALMKTLETALQWKRPSVLEVVRSA